MNSWTHLAMSAQCDLKVHYKMSKVSRSPSTQCIQFYWYSQGVTFNILSFWNFKCFWWWIIEESCYIYIFTLVFPVSLFPHCCFQIVYKAKCLAKWDFWEDIFVSIVSICSLLRCVCYYPALTWKSHSCDDPCFSWLPLMCSRYTTQERGF